MPQSTEAFWREGFGNEYLARNQVDWRARLPFWRHIADVTGANSAFEAGCSAGWNLAALREARPEMTLCGCEINRGAYAVASGAGFTIFHESALEPFGRANFDLVFTAGLLIHIPPATIKIVMANMALVSRRYVLAIEYADEKEVEVEYRGNSGKLWRRPFGKMYEDMGLEMVETMFLDKDQGFDRCTAWLLSKE